MDNFHIFLCEGTQHKCTLKARFFVEMANGTSSYTLCRGYGDPTEAVTAYAELECGGNQRKRLTMVDLGKRTVIARTK